MNKVNKIGLFFGSFNPIHIGHTAISNYILEYSDLSEIWFIVTPQNPFKVDDTLLDENLRLEMLKQAIVNETRFKAEDIEFNLPKPSYTANTLTELSLLHPSFNFVLIMGSDNYLNIDKWKDAEIITENYEIIVYPRLGYYALKHSLPLKTQIINAPIIDISSTMIRDGIKIGKKMMFFMPSGVYDYIKINNLYK